MTEAPKKRRGRGDGAIYWDSSKGRYVGAISLGHNADGTRRRVKASGRTKSEVREKLKELSDEIEHGVKSSARYTVADAADDWLRGGLKGVSDSTREIYRQHVRNHVRPGLGKRVLRDLTADDVDRWLEDRRPQLATSVLVRLLATLRRIIRQAQRRDRVVRNVAELVDAPSGKEGRPSKALTPDQAQAVLEAAHDSPLYAYITVSLLVGLRPEEARGLRWDHVDLANDPPSLAVWRSDRAGGDTKTATSRRTLALPPMAVEALRTHRSHQNQQRLKAGERWQDHGLAFASAVGTPLRGPNVRRAFSKVIAAAGLPPEWTPRELRHSFVSVMSAHGVPTDEIARLVGHSATSTTEQVYRKELRPVLTRGAEVMDSAIARKTG